MPELLILGPQLRTPCLGQALSQVRPGLQGAVVAITAGWQEREGELDALQRHLDHTVQDLRLYERTEALFESDPPLAQAHRARQERLKTVQELYRLRLAHAKSAARELFARNGGGESLENARRASVEALRRLDAELLRELDRVHAEFIERLRPLERPALAQQHGELASLLDRAELVLVAGGHVAVLLNRLRLLGLAELLRDRLVAAWSAGAMALTERVVLFHDSPPQGPGNPEVLEHGLGLLRGTVVLPDAGRRLKIEDSNRVQLLARRFAPARCYAVDDGQWLHWRHGRLVQAEGARRLDPEGRLVDAVEHA